MAGDNKVLGEFNLEDIAPAPRGLPQIEVTFNIDASGIVNVSAKDKSTGKEQKIRIQSTGGLTEDEIQQAFRDAEEHAAEDKKRRELAEARNQADTLIFTAEKTLKDAGDKGSKAERKAIEDAVSSLRSAMEGDDVDTIKTESETLSAAAMKLGEKIHRPETESADQGENGGDEEIIDADFEETDERKRAKGE